MAPPDPMRGVRFGLLARRFKLHLARSVAVAVAPEGDMAAVERLQGGAVPDRHDGRAGTRNYIAVISTVNCSAYTSRLIAQSFDRELLKDFPNIDGIVPLGAAFCPLSMRSSWTS